MPIRFIVTAWPGEYGPKVVMLLCSANSSRRRGVERRRGLAGDGVVGGDRAALLDDLAGRCRAG